MPALTDGIVVTGVRGMQPLRATDIPLQTPLNASAFQGDGGASVLRGVQIGQAIAAPLSKAIEYANPDAEKARELERQKMDFEMQQIQAEKDIAPLLQKVAKENALNEVQIIDAKNQMLQKWYRDRGLTPPSTVVSPAAAPVAAPASDMGGVPAPTAAPAPLSSAGVAPVAKSSGGALSGVSFEPEYEFNPFVKGGFAESETSKAKREISKGLVLEDLKSEQTARRKASAFIGDRALDPNTPMSEIEKTIASREHPLTAEQANAVQFADRMAYNEDALSKVIATNYDPTATLARGDLQRSSIPFLPNAWKTTDQQSYEAAKQNWIAAALRKESGAAISSNEYQTADQQYFPQPGDGKEVVAQKSKLRQIAQQNMMTAAGPEGGEKLAYNPTEAGAKDPGAAKQPAMAVADGLSDAEAKKLWDSLPHKGKMSVNGKVWTKP